MELQFKVKKDLNTVYNYLSNMDKFSSIHPIIYKITNTGNYSYKVYETLKFGFVPFSFTYPVTIKEDKTNKVITMYAIVFKLIKIKLKFSLTQGIEYTHIQEQIRFNTILPIKFILEKLFKKQHQALFENLDNLEASIME